MTSIAACVSLVTEDKRLGEPAPAVSANGAGSRNVGLVLASRMRGVYSALMADAAESEPSPPASSNRTQEWIHPISFRVNDDQFVVADALRATFHPPTFTEAFRWLLDSPEGRELIGRRVRGEI